MGHAECAYWMADRVPADVRRRAEIVFEVLSHVPLQQPVAVLAGDGRTVAVNVALLDLLGGVADDYLERDWSSVMPAWPRRATLFRPGGQVLEESLMLSSGDSVWARVSVGPVARPGGADLLGYVLFVSTSDMETVDPAEVRRLRKGCELLASAQTDYVVELDRHGLMSFVSPSFCQAVGARESELVGRPFLSRLCVTDRAAAAEALAEARRPPFCGEMQARLAADLDADVLWRMEAVIGDGVAGLELVGHVESAL
jgi:PAS domain-containing protein